MGKRIVEPDCSVLYRFYTLHGQGEDWPSDVLYQFTNLLLIPGTAETLGDATLKIRRR